MKRLVRALALLAATAVLLALVLVAVLWIEHRADVTLPTPTGPFAVGRTMDVWADAGGVDLFTGGKRELVMWIWYPAGRTSSATAAEYLPADWQAALDRDESRVVGLLTRDAVRIHAHSVADAPLSNGQGTYPVIILRGGLGALIAGYTSLAEDLASHGYVVVGFDAPYRTALVVFPDGRVVTRRAADNPETLSAEARYRLVDRLLTAWTADLKFAADRLEQLNASAGNRFSGRLDMRALGVAGHSLGGATAAEFCHEDSRCRAGIDIDGAPFGPVVGEGLRQPFLFLFSDHGRDSDPDSALITANFRSLFDHTPRGNRLQMTVRGANHFAFTDQMIVRPQVFVTMFRLASGLRLDPRRGLHITTDWVRRFFDVHLKGAAAAILKPSPDYPELQFN